MINLVPQDGWTLNKLLPAPSAAFCAALGAANPLRERPLAVLLAALSGDPANFPTTALGQLFAGNDTRQWAAALGANRFTCQPFNSLPLASAQDVNTHLYCAAPGATCALPLWAPKSWLGEFTGAVDFKESHASSFDLAMWYNPRNGTTQQRSPDAPPYQRVMELFNRAANAWLATFHGKPCGASPSCHSIACR